LEDIGETKTVVELRETLRKVDIDMNKRMALIEYLLFKYNKSVEELVNLPQGDQKQLEEAQIKLQKVNDALQDLQKQLEIQQQDLDAQRIAEANAKQSEAALKQAEAELKAAVEDLNKQEQAYNNQIKVLEEEINDPNTKTFNRSKASNLLAQLKQENPMPLRKAKITQEAALRRVEKERKKAEEASRLAQEATISLEKQKRKVEEAIKETEIKVQETTDYLEALKKTAVPRGAIWWIERELKEAQKYLPKKKQTL